MQETKNCAMLGQRIATSMITRQFTRNAVAFHTPVMVVAIRSRPYAKAVGPQPKLDPLSGPIGDELDPRFGDLPPWKVPVINRQNLTETPAVPYYDKQGRRYYGEPVDSISQYFLP